MSDPHDLPRFVAAQESEYSQVLAELRAGRKQSHWIWFIFPQLRGLGRSPTAEFYGIGSLAEARAYLAHPLLGARLRECVQEMLGHAETPLEAILGFPDNLKFRSSMTLFALAAPEEPLFRRALETFCGGNEDETTRTLLGVPRG
jgi:uncharacterized protein (DUF1810 family)